MKHEGRVILEAAGAKSMIACPREVGSECPHCAAEIVLGDPIMVCQACGTVHHRACWREQAAVRLVFAARRHGALRLQRHTADRS